VVDTTPPVITCPPNVTIDCTDPTDPDFTGYANCENNCEQGGGSVSGTSTPGGAIPDSDPDSPLCDVINITGAGGSVSDVIVDVAITHTWVGDLKLTLESAEGTVLTLLDRPGVPPGTFGCSDDNMNVSFDDAAATDAATLDALCGNPPLWYDGSAQPVDAFSALSGQNANGNWTLCVSDGAGGDLGTLDSWSITILLSSGDRISFTSDAAERTTAFDLSAYASVDEADKSNRADNPVDLSERTAGTTYSDVILQGNCPQTYTIVRTWTCEDDCGNTASCVQLIEVVDNTPPVLTCPPDVTVNCGDPTDPAHTGTVIGVDD
jgi:subtilisin-like proprotein convertase family protein